MPRGILTKVRLSRMRKRSLIRKTVSTFSFMLFVFFSTTLFSADRTEAQPASTQEYRLIGTIQSHTFTGAVLMVTKGEQSFFRLNDILPDGSRIVEVRQNSISLKGADGSPYEMYIAHEMSQETGNVASSVRPNTPPVDPYAPGAAIRGIGAEQPNSPVRPRGRSRRQLEEE